MYRPPPRDKLVLEVTAFGQICRRQFIPSAADERLPPIHADDNASWRCRVYSYYVNRFALSAALTTLALAVAVALRTAAGATTAPRPIASPVVSAPTLALPCTPAVLTSPRSTPAEPLTIAGAAATMRFPEMPRTIRGVAATKPLARNTITKNGTSDPMLVAEFGSPSWASGMPPLNWSDVMFRKRRTENGAQETQARGDSSEVATG